MNLIEISNNLPTELSCIEYLEKLRWGKKPKCAYCDSINLNKRTTDHRHKCKDCNKTTSVTINTLFHDTRIPLKNWILAVSLITDAKKGISALQLQRNINVSYPTAHSMYHKLRELMEEEIELDGVVEMDETYVGGKPRKGRAGDKINLTEKELDHYDERLIDLKDRFLIKEGTYKKKYDPKPHKRGRGTKKIPVVGMVERNGDVIAQVMRHTTYKNLRDMVLKHCNEDKTLVITDSYPAYNKFGEIFEHLKVDHQRMFSYRGINTNSIESFWAIVKRGTIGQYHSVSLKYLPNYVTEFVYKYNNRKNNEAMFEELLKRALNCKA